MASTERHRPPQPDHRDEGDIDDLFGLEENERPQEALAEASSPPSAKRRRIADASSDGPPAIARPIGDVGFGVVSGDAVSDEDEEVDDLFGVHTTDSKPSESITRKWLDEPPRPADAATSHPCPVAASAATAGVCAMPSSVKRELPAVKREHPSPAAAGDSCVGAPAAAPTNSVGAAGWPTSFTHALSKPPWQPTRPATTRPPSATAASSSKPTSFEAEAIHLAAIKREPRPVSAATAAGAPSLEFYKPILSNRDVLFTGPIMSAAEDDPAAAAAAEGEDQQPQQSVFQNAPSTFSTNSYFATSSSTQFPFMPKSVEELGRMLAERDDAPVNQTLEQAGGVSWPITMHGKSISLVSQTNAAKAKVHRRAALERSQEFTARTSTLPEDKHVHGPGISDHSTAKAHYDGYWELRTRKLAAQKANGEVYAELAVFQTREARAAAIDQAERKRRREEARVRANQMATGARPEDVPFALGQATTPTPEQQAERGQREGTGEESTSSQTTSIHPSAALSSALPSPSPSPSASPVGRPAVFAGVVVYLNGDTETRHHGSDLSPALDTDTTPSGSSSGGASGEELSSYHLANLVKLHGGRVLPYPSRTQLTHYIVDHLSYSKARSEFATMFVKKSRPAAASASTTTTIHFVKPAWIRACMQAGRRVREEPFAVVTDGSSRKIRDAFFGSRTTTS